ncbi:LPS export ABC transporter permease LptG [Qipengyuania sediminis]|uniref:LPS export ABC transporter permease LptG n=1 Tax=Qipengyuania sediminis TaxID=1532023 RepID=UPI00105A9EDB|nr:LPS export ABC transporter permease LptG [Qipengyuania sediminis]
MQLDFFPSRTLTLYLAKTFAVRILAVLIMLVLVLMMMDLLSESGRILAAPGNGQAELLTYASLRVPQLVARFLPYSVLLATLITLVTLNQNSEVIAMKAAGLSAHQVLAPLVLTAAVVSLASFAFNERVVTRATATLKAWQANQFGDIPRETDVRENVYVTGGRDILAADLVTGRGANMRMRGVSYYERSATGMITARIAAPTARYAAPGWVLTNARRLEVQGADSTAFPRLVVGRAITPQQIELSKVDPETKSFWTLTESIRRYEDAGRNSDELRTIWWHKISGPLSALLMPILGSIAAFGLARSGQLFVRALIGMALGFAYFVVDNAALAMGGFGGYPPFLAAFAPFFLFLLIGETVLIRTEE